MKVDRWGKTVPRATRMRRRIRLFAALVLITMVSLGTLVENSGPYFSGSSGGSSVPAGLFVSSQSPNDVLSLGQRLGVTPTVMTVYADGSCYCSYASPPSTSMTLMLGVGALTTSEATSIGQSLVEAGQSNAIIRIMWEQNQDVSGWFQDWNQLSLTAAQYISTFQSIVTTMRAVSRPGVQVHVEPQRWHRQRGAGADVGRHLAGPGLRQLRRHRPIRLLGIFRQHPGGVAFAQSQGLPAAIPEWGLNGSDDPSYINSVSNLVNNPANNFALQAYFSYDGGSGGINSDITQFPASEAEYTVDFSGSNTSPPSTTPTSVPPVTTTSAPSTTTTSAPPTRSAAPHVMVVMMENEGASQIIGNTAVPFINSLASTYGSATKSYAVNHPSLPNYLDIVSGSNSGRRRWISRRLRGAIPGSRPLADQLAGAGYSRNGIRRESPQRPRPNDSGLYAVRHFPWEYFPGHESRWRTHPRCHRISTVLSPPTSFGTRRTSPTTATRASPSTPPARSWPTATPSSRHSSLRCRPPRWYKAGGQIIIEWDEALDSDTSGLNGGSGGHVATLVVSAALKANPQQDATAVDTVGILRSIEDTYGLSYLGGNTSDGNIDSLLNTTTTTPTTTPPTTTPTTTTTTRPPSTTTTAPRPPSTTTTAPRPPSTTTTAPTTTTVPTTTPPTTTPPGAATVPTSTTITVEPEVGTSAQRLTASISPAPAGGTVQFTVDGWVVGDAIPLSSDGTAVMALYIANGPHAIDATYSGDPNSESSGAATVVGVGQALTTLLAAPPTRIGSDQLYQLRASLSSSGSPIAGAAVWFSAAGSALCVSTTDATGLATCSIDEGATDVFSLATQGDSVAFGGDSTHLPASGHSPTPGSDNDSANLNGRSGSPGPLTARRGNTTSGPASASPPVSPASAAATDTPATLDADNASTVGSGSGDAGGLFLLVGLLGAALVGAATLGRRRLSREPGNGPRGAQRH